MIRPKVCACTAFKIYKTLDGKTLTDNQLETLITKGIITELKGFMSTRTNEEFSAKVKLVDKITVKLV